MAMGLASNIQLCKADLVSPSGLTRICSYPIYKFWGMAEEQKLEASDF